MKRREPIIEEKRGTFKRKNESSNVVGAGNCKNQCTMRICLLQLTRPTAMNEAYCNEQDTRLVSRENI